MNRKEDCTVALREAKSMLSTSCNADDTFDLNGYRKRFNTTRLEPNSVAVIDMLMARHNYDFRTSPIGDAERGYCMTDLQERWAIHDGLMIESLYGIDEFSLKTNRHRIDHPLLSDMKREELDYYTSCLQGLHEEISSMTCYPFLSIEDLATNILDEHFQSSCTNDCEASIQRLELKTYRACSELISY